jgi:hypothetical protein
MSWFTAWFGYGLGKAAGESLFGYGKPSGSPPSTPIRMMTEAEIRADEVRFTEEAKRLDDDEARKR